MNRIHEEILTILEVIRNQDPFDTLVLVMIIILIVRIARGYGENN